MLFLPLPLQSSSFYTCIDARSLFHWFWRPLTRNSTYDFILSFSFSSMISLCNYDALSLMIWVPFSSGYSNVPILLFLSWRFICPLGHLLFYIEHLHFHLTTLCYRCTSFCYYHYCYRRKGNDFIPVCFVLKVPLIYEKKKGRNQFIGNRPL